MRNADKGESNFERCAAVLDGAVPVQTLAMGGGTLVLIRGRNAMDRVTQVQGRRTRMLAVLAMWVYDSLDIRHLDVQEQAANEDCDVRPANNPQTMAPSGSFFGQVLLSSKYDLLMVKHQSHSMDIAGILFSLFMLARLTIHPASSPAGRSNNSDQC